MGVPETKPVPDSLDNILATNQTLAQALGETEHTSPLLYKVRNLAGTEDPARCLKQLAVNRGCRHYDGAFKRPNIFPEELNSLSNEEAGIVLCLGQLPYDPANVISFRLLTLAIRERCQTVIGYIARCGKQVEPQNHTWDKILAALEPTREPPLGSQFSRSK